MNKKRTYHAETLTPGFYFLANENVVRCYYLTGTKKGNKWIEMDGIDNPEWWSLIWTCIPTAEELTECKYFKQNPTDYFQ